MVCAHLLGAQLFRATDRRSNLAYVSMQRIETFLGEEEVPDWATSLKRKTADRKPLPPLPSASSRPPHPGRGKGKGKDGEIVGFEKGIFTWSMVTRGRPHAPFKLGPLDLTFPIGELSLVSGATGSGKTALLLSLLGGGFLKLFWSWALLIGQPIQKWHAWTAKSL